MRSRLKSKPVHSETKSLKDTYMAANVRAIIIHARMRIAIILTQEIEITD